MAVMIPDDDYFEPKSNERAMFEALKKLPNEYFVLHSFRVVRLVPNKGLNENEIDFIIYNHKYGALFLECKNSFITYDDNKWYYLRSDETKIPMKDPFNQAFAGQYALFGKLKEIYENVDSKMLDIINRCKVMVGVWLPKYTKNELYKTNLFPNITKDLVLGKEDLENTDVLLKSIEGIMNQMDKIHLVPKLEIKEKKHCPGYEMRLSEDESKLFFESILCPQLRLTIDYKANREETYKKLLAEQCMVLDFLGYQRTAAISGDSGTGKTLVALERARRISFLGEKILFLCYNVNLKNWLEEKYSNLMNVTFSTIDALCVNECKTSYDKINYSDLYQVLKNKMVNGKFEYDHIIVDEGQDFGSEGKEDSKILELFSDYGNGKYTNDKMTSFFIFYDKNQLVNCDNLPSYLNNVDSKLTLYKNCRNTQNIAKTAFALIEKKSMLNDNAIKGEKPLFIFYKDHNDFIIKLNQIIKKLKGEEKVIITCDSLKKSEISTEISLQNGNYSKAYKCSNGKVKVYTSSTFKGLESNYVLLLDFDDSCFENNNKRFYVAASRAKLGLFIFVNENTIHSKEILTNKYQKSYFFKDTNDQLIKILDGNVCYELDE